MFFSSFLAAGEKNTTDSGGAANAYTIGPKKIKQLFRRHSATRVCPDDFNQDTGGADSPATLSPSPTDSPKNPAFLFSGTMTPVPLIESEDVGEGFLTSTQLYNSLNDGQLSPYLFDPSFMLIVDTRSLEDYCLQHILTAKHISELHNPKEVEPLGYYTMIILYDHKGLSHSLKDSVMGRTLDSLQSKRIYPFVLIGGFDLFHAKHSYLCISAIPSLEKERRLIISSYPSIVVEEQLFLGRGDQATNRRVVADLGITHIVNVTKDHPQPFEDCIKYLHLAQDDDTAANLLQEFPSTTEFIVGALSSDGRVLVHCNLGVSRSSTIVIAYLMYTRRWSLRDAHHFLRDRRPIVHPNRGFFNQLSRFEEMLFGRKVTSSDLWIRS